MTGWWVMWALGQDPRPEAVDVRESLESGLVVDWTDMSVEVVAGSYRLRSQSTKAVEQSARLAVDDLLQDHLGAVRVAPGVDVASLVEDPALSGPLASRRSRWRVAEATYAASGKVDLLAQLSLQEFLKPWTLARATPTPAQPEEGAWTGVVVDARGATVVPVVAPRVEGPDGAVVWSGELWDEDAVTTNPVVWLASESHPSMQRVGDRPLWVRATGNGEGVLSLDAAGAADLARLVGKTALGRGHVVVLVDP